MAIDLHRLLQDKMKALDAQLDKLGPAEQAARNAYEEEKRNAEARLQVLRTRWERVNGLYRAARAEREQIFKTLGAA